ncbi:MAG: EMC6-like membrane protein [Methanobacterium sp.]
MDVDGKVAAIHGVAAVVAGYISFLLASGAIAGLGKNEVLALLGGLIILYLAGQVSDRVFGKEEVGGVKGWLWSGIVPFFFIWLVVWIIFLNFHL